MSVHTKAKTVRAVCNHIHAIYIARITFFGFSSAFNTINQEQMQETFDTTCCNLL